MLSRMPLCFNLFGTARETAEAQLDFVRAVFDPSAATVEMIEVEWTPRNPLSTINDRTAFDAAIVTRRSDGSRHLVGIETKCTEPFSQTRYGSAGRPDADTYGTIHDSCGWFDSNAHDRLVGSTTNQLWRNCLLAAAVEKSGEVDSASIAVVAVVGDHGAAAAIAGVGGAMTDTSRCRLVSLESIVAEARGISSLAGWANRFEERYLDTWMVKEIDRRKGDRG